MPPLSPLSLPLSTTPPFSIPHCTIGEEEERENRYKKFVLEAMITFWKAGNFVSEVVLE